MFIRTLDQLTKIAPLILYSTIAFGILSGGVIAIVWQIENDWTVYQPPIVITALGYLVAILVSAPNALRGGWQMWRGEWRQGWRNIFSCVGIVIVLLSAELGSHYLLPCPLLEAWNLGAPDWGIISFDGREAYMCLPIRTTLSPYVWSRIHLLHHTLLGGLPLAILYGFILHRTK